MPPRMTNSMTPSSAFPPNPIRSVGFWAVLTGAVAVALVFLHIFAPSLQPAPSIGDQIGEIAGDIKRSAWRSFFGLSAPTPEPASVSWTHYLGLIAPIMGLGAIVLSVVSGVRGENRRYVVYGTGLGAAAVVFHFFWWVTLVVAGVMLLVAILENIGDIFSF